MNKTDTWMELEHCIRKEYSNIAGLVIIKDGELQYSYYGNGCHADSRIHVYSVTKSILSILIGIAIDRGYIIDTKQKITDFFPSDRMQNKKQEDSAFTVTLQHMLTMTAPYTYRFAPYRKYFMSEDWLQFSLDHLGGRKKPGAFRYAGVIGPDILSGILMQTTGQSVLEFANRFLFSPLGIEVKNTVTFADKNEQIAFSKATNVSGWVADAKGVHTGGWGLTLSAADMAKIGQLYLNKGEWEGQTIVTNQWIQKSTTKQSRWKRISMDYGYLWWICDDGSFAAMGDGGNTIYVNPHKQLVISIASIFKYRSKDRLSFIKRSIEPIFDLD